jgi:hypothetical protein
MTPEQVATSVMTYRHHDEGWHELIFHESSHAAVDALYAQLNLFFQKPLTEKIHVLVDMTESGTLPIVYGFQTIRPLMTRYPQRPRTRYAFLSANRLDLIRLVKTAAVAIHPQINANYFGSGQRAAALTWLLQDLQEA